MSALLEGGREVVVADNFLTGHHEGVAPGAHLHEADIRDPHAPGAVCAPHPIDDVLHFVASSLVGESMERPLDHFNNNVLGVQRVLEAMRRHGVIRIVFSSSAAVHGEPGSVPIPEAEPLAPANPYGEGKRVPHWAALTQACAS